MTYRIDPKLREERVIDDSLFPYGKFKRLRRSSLGQIKRIEALRWRNIGRLEMWQSRFNQAWQRVKALGEAFIPCGQQHPQRIFSCEGGVSNDAAFWDRPKTKFLGEGPLCDLADVGAVNEWEDVELPRRAARVTEEKLQAGRDYDRASLALETLWRRARFFDDLLDCSIRELHIVPLHIVPPGNDFGRERLYVKINNRLYAYCREGYFVRSLVDEWPNSHTPIVIAVSEFNLDESVVGLERSTFRARFGDPTEIWATRKTDLIGNIWIYGDVGVKFTRYEVSKFLDSKTVAKIRNNLDRSNCASSSSETKEEASVGATR